MKSPSEYFYYVWKRIAERTNRKKYHIQFDDYIKLYEETQEVKPIQQIKSELTALKKFWGIYPFQYYRYGMYRSDFNWTLDKMKDVVPFYFSHHLFYPRHNKKYFNLFLEKNLCNAIFKAYHIPHPKALFKYFDGCFFSETEDLINGEKVKELVSQTKAGRLYVKPFDGSEGKGIVCFERDSNGMFFHENDLLSPDFFKSDTINGSYIIEEGLDQIDYLNQIYHGSVNTIRFITRNVSGKIEILYTFLKTGAFGGKIDNAGSGGIFVKINVEDGSLDEFAYSNDFKSYVLHPDTKFVFKGSKLPDWENIKKFVVEVTRKFWYLKYVGWDVAITPNGPVVIEVNSKPDLKVPQLLYGGARITLGIGNPKNYFYNKNFTLAEN